MMDNKPIETSKYHHTKQNAVPQDTPLDPAVERVRKKLVRLMIVSISITLILILAVLVGVIYKIAATGSTPKQIASFSPHNQNNEVAHHTLSLPKNAKIWSQSLSEHDIVFKILTPDGQEKFMIYNYHTGALIAVFSVKTIEEETSPPFP
ncbi:putative PurR-regulated permease PerM [Bartonella silvatica]|uniref:PurR-regulated permease PerM n=1 Tax=Bartonella silvatica TaxID=357760 RepID=A0ABV2HIT9_9HYPH